METVSGIFAVSLILLFFLFFPIMWIRTAVRFRKFKKKYTPITDIEAEVSVVTKERDQINSDIEKLRESYKQKKLIFDRIVRQVAIYDEEIELAELGFYKPHFDFDTSEKFKEAISKCKEKQKKLVKDKKAVTCPVEWSVEGSKSKGKTMTNRNIRLTSRAFNNECDALIANVRWNNITRMEERLSKAYEAIEKMNASNKIFISKQYVNLKLEELRLTHEYRDKKQKEKEEQAEIRQQMREEAKLQQEVETAQKDENKYQNLLDKAKKEAEKAAGAALEKIQLKMAKLEQELQEAHEKNERAKSMAQQTKAGHVYIISNIGSFGEDVYKIGMTRRLDPMDRVKELGDASVPFIFDVHAMVYSEDAPSLENELHKVFDIDRLNLVNTRKEFFNVNLDSIKEEVFKKFPDVEFIETAEARQYKESLALRQKMRDKEDEPVMAGLPDEI